MMNPVRSALWKDYMLANKTFDALDKAYGAYMDGAAMSEAGMLRNIPPALQAVKNLQLVGRHLRATAQSIKTELSQIKGY